MVKGQLVGFNREKKKMNVGFLGMYLAKGKKNIHIYYGPLDQNNGWTGSELQRFGSDLGSNMGYPH